MQKFVTVFLIVMVWSLAACSAADATPSPASTAVVTPQIVKATNTPLPTHTSTPPPTPTPLPTDAPTLTPTITPTPTNTPIPETAVDQITLAPIVTEGLERPLYLTHAFDERLFILEQPGRIRIFSDGALLEEPFLDLTARVDSVELEQGLLGLAFHPDYMENGRFYVNYTNLDGHTHISEFKVSDDNPNLADSDSEIVLLTIEQPYPNHNGGQITFGPDGYLYIGVGDGGSANDPLRAGQDPTTLLGTILRLDINHVPGQYAIPADNPFVTEDENRNEIWAWGLRNPWRFSFDRVTGDLFISDVGQNLWEEIDFQPAASSGGENYGWNIMEGLHCFNQETCDNSGLIAPIHEYGRENGCSITGGYVYRGEQFLELYGNYFFSDFCQGTFWRLFPESDGSWSVAEVLDTEYPIASFGEDFHGELYAFDHNGGVYQIRP